MYVYSMICVVVVSLSLALCVEATEIAIDESKRDWLVSDGRHEE